MNVWYSWVTVVKAEKKIEKNLSQESKQPDPGFNHWRFQNVLCWASERS